MAYNFKKIEKGSLKTEINLIEVKTALIVDVHFLISFAFIVIFIFWMDNYKLEIFRETGV